MAVTRFALDWKYSGGEYIAEEIASFTSGDHTYHVYGSSDKNILRPRSLEVNASLVLTTNTFVLEIDGVTRVLRGGVYQSYNFTSFVRLIRLLSGSAGDSVSLTFYSVPKWEFR
ncbi:MAG: hypothetical protein ACREBU_00545 [Nitrososphaera sp.]